MADDNGERSPDRPDTNPGAAMGPTTNPQGFDSAEAARFATVFRALPDAVVLTDPERRIVLVNPALCDLFGYTREELYGKHTAIIYTSHDDYEEQGRVRFNLSAEEQLAPYEAEYRKKNGDVFSGETVGTAVRDDDGHVVGFLGIIRDISERKRLDAELKAARDLLEQRINERTAELTDANQRLRNEIDAREKAESSLGFSDHYLRSIIEAEPECVKLVELDGTLVEMNAAGLAMIEAENAQAVIGKNVLGLVVEEDRESFQSLLEGIARGEDGTLQFRVVGLRGTPRWLETHAVPFRDERDAHTLMLGITRDISARKEAEDRLRQSEQRVALHVQQTPLGVIEWDLGFTVVDWNPGAERIFGYSRAEALGRHAAGLIVPESAGEHVQGVWADLLAKRGGTRSTNDNMTKDGGTITCEWYNTPLVSKTGEVIGVASLVLDVTERIRMEATLRKAEAKNRAMIDAIPDMMFLVDREGMFLDFLPSDEVTPAMAPEEFIGMKVGDILPSAIADQALRAVRRALDRRGTQIFSYQLPEDDHVKFYEARVVASAEDTCLVLVRDISEHRRLEEDLRQAQKMEAIGTLTGGIAHEFNNIMTSIIGFGEFLEDGIRRGNPLREYVDTIMEGARRAAKITSGLLAYSRKQVTYANTVDLNEMLRGLGLLLVSKVPDNVMLGIHPADGKLCAAVDRSQIEQVIVNLVDNAVDAMGEGGTLTLSTARVEIAGEADPDAPLRPGEYARITVADTGEGIDAAQREKIFEPFFTTKEVGKGTGLGLAIVYGIVAKHEGHVAVESGPGRGTTFRVYLPLTASVEEASGPEAPLEPPESGGETILVAEDDENVRTLVAYALTRAGYQVLEAVNGNEAVEIFRREQARIALLLLDIEMPEKSGKAAHDEIRVIDPDVRTIFLSGHAFDDTMTREILDQGCTFLTKPIAPTDLLRRIREALD